MRILFGLLLIFIGLIGAPIAFMSQIIIKSSINVIDGKELSVWLGVLAIIVLLNGFYVLITDN